ncbi:MAG: AAA family ATPase [Longimicrobiales bacterium]
MLDCVLISSDENFRHAVLGITRQPAAQCRLVLDLQSSAGTLDRVNAGSIIKAQPKVAFLDLGKGPSGLEGIRMLSQEMPDLAMIVAGPELSAEELLAVIRAGANEYLPRPFTREDVQDAFLRVRRRVSAGSPEEPVTSGRVSTVFSAKGGTGVTTIATNLAVALRRLTQKEVLLVDLAPSMGTAAVAMGLEPRYTYLDLIQNFHRVDEELLRSFLETHESGVHLLASPVSPGDEVAPSTDDIRGLIGLCQKHFDYIVIDGGSTFSSELMTILHESEDRLLVATPELPALRNLKRAIDAFVLTNGRIAPRLILNQYKEGHGLSVRDVEDGLAQRVTVVLEKDDPGILTSVNVGRPEVLTGKSPFAMNLMDLGSEIAGPDHLISTPRKGFLGRLFKASKPEHREGKESK